MLKGSSYLLIMLCTAGSMVTMFVADRNVRKVKNQADFAKYYDEDDIYYLLGKKNPNAPRVQERGSESALRSMREMGWRPSLSR